MGERVQAGPLIYTVTEVEWLNQIGGRTPKTTDGKFAVIRLSITNAGRRELSVPMLQLVAENGEGAMELTDPQGLDEWLGVLRALRPAETIQGRIVFEVKARNYRLRATDAADPDRESFVLINIPLRLDQRAPVSLDLPSQEP
jgi:hypothetical protein